MEEKYFAELFSLNNPLRAVIQELLADRTTGKNIVWGTETYASFGAYYHGDKQMLPDFTLNLILNGTLLPRILKNKEQQKVRTKSKAEVFTPAWICNDMNNHCDEDWFGHAGMFNTENDDHTWTTNEHPIDFGETRRKHRAEWQRYVDSRRIEITCGEAPYLVSRYDTATGKAIRIKDRIGILDRKLRVVNENAKDEKEWLTWACRAFEATYGFEYQGDNLFLARVNLVQTFIEYYTDRFGQGPTLANIQKVVKIVSWNLWQMDGLKDTAPFDIPEDEFEQLSMIEPEQDTHVLCRIKNWRSRKTVRFQDIRGEKREVKFDYCIGNPPYQGDNHQQVYPDFYLAARDISNCVDMIFPVGWQEPKKANNLGKLNRREVKEDQQIVLIDNRHNIFSKDVAGAEWTNIIIWKNGYDNELNGKQLVLTNGKSPQKIHLAYEVTQISKPSEIKDLFQCVLKCGNFTSVSEITSVLKPYGLRTDVISDPEKYGLPPFHSSKTSNSDIKIYGLRQRKSVIAYVSSDYPIPRKTSAFKQYKVFVPYAWGNMSKRAGLGGAFSSIIIASPNEICTESYLESGAFVNRDLAMKHAKFLMTKFCRALLYLNKYSHHSTSAWGAVPVQDYHESFWNNSVEEIDLALMSKYKVPNNIRDFVFQNVQTKSEKDIVNYRETVSDDN